MHHVLLIKAPTAPRPGDGIGRHARLKIWCPYGCGGSSPPLGTILLQQIYTMQHNIVLITPVVPTPPLSVVGFCYDLK